MTSLGTTEPDIILATYEQAFRAHDHAESESYHTKSLALAEAREFLMAHFGKQEGWPRFKEWAQDLGLGAAVRSRMLTVGEYLPDERAGSLCAVYQYQVARSIRLGKGEPADLLAEALVIPMLDFCEKHGLRRSREPKPQPIGVCPACSHQGPLSDFEEEK